MDWVSSVGWSADLGAGVAGSCFIFFVCTGFCEQLRVRCGLGYQRHLMRIKCDC